MSGWTLVFQIVNFLVLAALLRRFLFRPVTAMVVKRQHEIESAASDVERGRHDAEELHARAEKALTLAVETRDRAVGEGRAQAEREREAVLAQTRGEAQAILDTAKRDVEVEREKVADRMASGAVEIGTVLARRLLGQVVTEPIAEMFLARLCKDLDGLSDEHKGSLLEDIGAQEVVVATAPALGQDAATRWLAEIAARLRSGVGLRIVTDESLVAGAELRFPHRTISFCWRDGIESARKDLVHP